MAALKTEASAAKKHRKAGTATKAKPEVRSKRTNHSQLATKKKRTYTAEQLGVPKLNGIVPVGVVKPKGKKKGKIFVDDAKSMLAIMNMVQAEKEGEREGKIMRQRQLEEIREAKRVEVEQKSLLRQEKFNKVKDGIKTESRGKKRTKPHDMLDESAPTAIKTKKVSFG